MVIVHTELDGAEIVCTVTGVDPLGPIPKLGIEAHSQPQGLSIERQPPNSSSWESASGGLALFNHQSVRYRFSLSSAFPDNCLITESSANGAHVEVQWPGVTITAEVALDNSLVETKND